MALPPPRAAAKKWKMLVLNYVYVMSKLALVVAGQNESESGGVGASNCHLTVTRKILTK
jgi:hypothetical protein